MEHGRGRAGCGKFFGAGAQAQSRYRAWGTCSNSTVLISFVGRMGGLGMAGMPYWRYRIATTHGRGAHLCSALCAILAGEIAGEDMSASHAHPVWAAAHLGARSATSSPFLCYFETISNFGFVLSGIQCKVEKTFRSPECYRTRSSAMWFCRSCRRQARLQAR